MRIAERFLRASIKSFKIKEYETAQMIAYNSIFHACRALLFLKGYKERNHVGLIEAVRTSFQRENCKKK